jgi:molybdopterin/thiamine biosynthesis adenylyltransferase
MGGKKNPTGVKELGWVLDAEVQSEALRCLFETGSGSRIVEERGFLGEIHVGAGKVRRTLYLRRIIDQEPGWVGYGGHGLSFSPRYFSRALDEVVKGPPGTGIIIVHSHPFPTRSKRDPPGPSKPDLYHERRLLFQLARSLPVGAPVAAGILVSNGAWRVREYRWPRPQSAGEATSRRFGIDSATLSDATVTRIVSPNGLEVLHPHLDPVPNTKTLDSTLRLWGEDGQRMLGGIRVGIAGLGGVGSILVEFLARLGVGELILVDFDTVSDENLNRLVGAHRNEVGKPKIDYASRIAKEAATANPFNVRTLRGSIAEADGFEQILDADIVMNAADSPLARQVLDHVSYAYEIPVIDGGTVFLVQDSIESTKGKSQVSVAGPGHPCLECSGVYTQEEATMARENPSMLGPKAYIRTTGQNSRTDIPRAPSVISHNGLVASLMVQRLLSTVLGFPPKGKRGQQRYYSEEGQLGWGPVDVCKADCPKHTWVGMGDSHPAPIGIDPAWKQMRGTLG